MTEGITVTCQTHLRRGSKGRKEIRAGTAPCLPPPRVPRVTKLMALAIRWEGLIATGVVADYAEIARLVHLTRARATQISNLLNLAPDIQEELLALPAVENGEDPVHERQLRRVVAVLDWRQQRTAWRALSLGGNANSSRAS